MAEETTAAPKAAESKSSGEVLFQHPSFPDNVLIVPADKVKEYEEAEWVRVKRADEDALREKAVPSPVTHKLHFGNSLVP